MIEAKTRALFRFNRLADFEEFRRRMSEDDIEDYTIDTTGASVVTVTIEAEPIIIGIAKYIRRTLFTKF